MNTPQNNETSRRHFLKTSALLGGALMAPAILPGRASGAGVDNVLKVGLIGCGGRGTGAASQALAADKNVVLTAMADVFSDRLQSSLETLRTEHADKVKVEPAQQFIGFDAYQKVIDSGVDVVLLAAPPGFRPAHLKAAVDAGKHIFTEKPMAVDAPGVRSVLATAEEANRKNLSIVSGFCWRYSFGDRAAYRQVHDGAIGKVTALYSTYNTGTNNKWDKWTRDNCKGEMEWQLRRWYFFPWLSGDHIVEQAVHNVDKMAWAMGDDPPVAAVAHGGRQVRTGPEFGSIYDHFAVVYEYWNGAKGFLFCRQQDGAAGGVTDTIIGEKGVCEIVSGRKYQIKGETDWRYTGPKNDKYQTEHDELFAAIRAGKPINDGVWMAHSTMKAILGRMAAYTGQRITWEDAINSQESLMPEKLDWNNPPPQPPVPMPGITKFV